MTITIGNAYTLTVDLDGGNGSTANGSYASGGKININAGTKSGYTFNHWTTSDGGTFDNANDASTAFTMPGNATTITAHWTQDGSANASTAVSGVSLNLSTMALMAGGATGTLYATVSPANATNQNVTWSTSNSSVATVANGVVTPVAAGTTIITVTTADGNKTADCLVTVNAASSSSDHHSRDDSSSSSSTTKYTETNVIAESKSPRKYEIQGQNHERIQLQRHRRECGR